MSIRIGSLCSGYRGLDMAVEQVFGGTTTWVSEVDPGANKILAHRWPGTPNIGDLTTAKWDEVEPVDIVCGGYPCQPFSTAGKRKGTTDARHLWPFIAGALRVLRPRVAIFENVANHLRLGFDTVLCDLADIGFDAEWQLVQADEVGAPHQRKRLIVLATATDAQGEGLPWQGLRGRAAERGGAAADASHLGHERSWGTRGGRPGPADSGVAAADADGGGRWRGPGIISGLRSSERVEGDQPRGGWGKYTPAIARWEAATGRPAPWATDDRHRLSPQFVEWMMGLPAGHVTDVPDLTRTQQLKALGNGVVPQQAAAALRLLAARAFDGAVAA
jgi:DNA (cytosine-5)-methyltransferase 1